MFDLVLRNIFNFSEYYGGRSEKDKRMVGLVIENVGVE